MKKDCHLFCSFLYSTLLIQHEGDFLANRCVSLSLVLKVNGTVKGGEDGRGWKEE